MVAPEISTYVVPSVEDCHCHDVVPLLDHVPPVAVNVEPTRAVPAIVGATVFVGATSPGVVPLPAFVEPLVSNAT